VYMQACLRCVMCERAGSPPRHNLRSNHPGAITPQEELTVLGRHLSALPIEPTIGKALIYSVLLRCVAMGPHGAWDLG